jgi:hypothetical protein
MKHFSRFLMMMGLLLVLGVQGVLAQAVTGVTLNKNTLTLNRWGSEKLIATISPANAADTNVVWSSTNPKVVSVDNEGNVSANHDGVAAVYVTTDDGGFTDRCVVTCQVNDAANIVEFSFDGEINSANISDDNLTVIGFMPHGTDVTNLTVAYQISPGATISPLPETVLDYSDTVRFVVTAPDGKTQKTWKVFPMVFPDLSLAQRVRLDFKTAPQGWIGDTVSWEDDNFRYFLDYPNPGDNTWPPSAQVGYDENVYKIGIALFPARLHVYVKDTSKVIVHALMYIMENCADSCTYVQFLGENHTDREYIDAGTREYHIFKLSTVKAFQVDFRSYEGSFNDISFWLANKDGTVNHPPVADAGPDQTVHSNDTVQLDGSASIDPDQTALSYQWTAPQGVSLDNSSAMQPTFVAPNSMDTLHLTFTLSVSDGSLSSTDQVVITVIPTNHVPVADAGPDQSVYSNDSVYLDGTGSTDADGDSLVFTWFAPGGIQLTDPTSATPAFLAPEVPQPTTFSFGLLVEDGLTTSVMDTVFIRVEHRNQRPIAWFDIDSTSVFAGDTADIYGHYSYDPDGDSLRFHWWTDQGSGLVFYDSTAMDVRCATPMVHHDTTFRIYMKVDDGVLTSVPDTFYLTVMKKNTIPVAVLAKHTAPVFDGDTVFLDGSASYDADGDVLSYIWGSPKGVFLNEAGDSAWFVAPIVKGLTPFIFTLKVNDGTSDSQADMDTVWVNHKNHTPVAEAGYPIELSEGDSSYLYGSLSYDFDGDSLSYSWVVPDGFWIADSTQADSRFSAPMVQHDTSFNLILKVFDGQVWSAPDTCLVTVKNKNHAPVAAIVSTAQIFYGVSMNEGDSLWIDGSPSYDPDGDSITYDWFVPKDFDFYYYDSVKTLVVAHEVAQTTSFDASLMVSDGLLRNEKRFIIQVLNVNRAPYAYAGKDFRVLSGQTAQLDGSDSYDPDMDSLRYTWTAPAGIVLDNPNAMSPHFVAPQVTVVDTLTFDLVVSDGQLNSVMVHVQVTVLPLVASLSVSPYLNDTLLADEMRHVSIYYRDGNSWIPENVLSYENAGISYFAVWQGQWMISVDPLTDSAGFVSTFSGDVPYWSEGNAFTVTAGAVVNQDIHLIPVSDNLTGDGRIDGVIYRDPDTTTAKRSSINRLDKTQSDLPPAEGVTVFLYQKSDDALLASRLTDENGTFIFDKLPHAVYYLSVQLPGYDENEHWDVVVSDTTTQVDSVNFVINEAQGSVTDVPQIDQMEVHLYPNPTNVQLQIRIADIDARQSMLHIYDITGHMMVSMKMNEPVVKVDMSQFTKGIYFVRITNHDKVVTRKIVKQ